MKFMWNGQEFGKDISKYANNQVAYKSESEQQLHEILLEIFKGMPIYRELPCVGTQLRLDFYIRKYNIAFEFDGQQHKEFNPFFHGTRANFARQVRRDKYKEDWCEQNGITLIRVTADTLSTKFINDSFRRMYSGKVYNRTDEAV
jgi:very-short-patch-repair endonuclease